MKQNDTKALQAEIRRMCKEKNAVVLAHYYTVGEVQEVADFVGDSLALARKAAQTDADIIVMCGVHFMAETCKLLSPEKLVLAPDLSAGCSLADSCDAEDLRKWKAEHPDYMVVQYVNTTAATKALTDVVVTSGNAKKVVCTGKLKSLLAEDKASVKNLSNQYLKYLLAQLKGKGSIMTETAYMQRTASAYRDADSLLIATDSAAAEQVMDSVKCGTGK